jgi:aspartyl protease family protein
MRNIILFAFAALAAAVLVPRLYLDKVDATVTPAVIQPQPVNYRTLTLARSDNGHFETDATIDGRRMHVLVDTGATHIALREADAARLGIHPAQRDYTAQVTTANGTVLAARTELNRVEMGGIVVFNVAALVLPDEALSQNLLGMSFLSRVRFEHRDGRLVLEQ